MTEMYDLQCSGKRILKQEVICEGQLSKKRTCDIVRKQKSAKELIIICVE